MPKYNPDVSSEEWNAPNLKEERELETLAFQMWVYMNFTKKKPTIDMYTRWTSIRDDIICRKYHDAAANILSGKHVEFLKDLYDEEV